MKTSAVTKSLKKEQKNFRLSYNCRKMIDIMAMEDGLNESALLEIVIRQEWIRRQKMPLKAPQL